MLENDGNTKPSANPKEAVQMLEIPEVIPKTPEEGLGDLHRAAQTIGQNLGTLLCGAIDGLGRSKSAQIAELEGRVSSLGQLAEEVSTLRADFAALRAEAGSESEDRQLFSTKLASIETALRAQQDSQQSQNEKVEAQSLQLQMVAELVAQLRTLLAQLQEGQQLLLKRLNVQAEALRALHHTAQEHAAQKEELRTAVQKLERIAGAQAEVGPLPEDI